MPQGEWSELLHIWLAASIPPISVVIKQEKDGAQLAQNTVSVEYSNLSLVVSSCESHVQRSFIQWNV